MQKGNGIYVIKCVWLHKSVISVLLMTSSPSLAWKKQVAVNHTVELNLSETHESLEADWFPLESPDESADLANTLTAPLQGVPLSHPWTPDPWKPLDKNCILFKAAKFVVILFFSNRKLIYQFILSYSFVYLINMSWVLGPVLTSGF